MSPVGLEPTPVGLKDRNATINTKETYHTEQLRILRSSLHELHFCPFGTFFFVEHTGDPDIAGLPQAE